MDLQHLSPRLMLRQSVVDALSCASEMLDPDYDLVLMDEWRSVRFQQELVDYYGITGEFVSDPTSQSVDAPHTTGGAVDLTLSYQGVPLALGTDYDSFNASAYLGWVQRTYPDSTASRIQGMLYAALTSCGFAPLSSEWWHWSYGDQHWADFHSEAHSLYRSVNMDGSPAYL